MSLESQLEALNANLVTLITVMRGSQVTAQPAIAPTPQVAPVSNVVPLSFANPQGTPAPVASAMPAMPPPPSFAPGAPVPTPGNGALPFHDAKTMTDYVMSAYKALGAAKGGKIQDVLTGLGYRNIGDVKPEHYPQLHAGVEALRAAP